MKRNYWLVLLLFLILSLGCKSIKVYSSEIKVIDNKINQIDLSEVTFIKSETERDIQLEKAFSKVYDLKPGEDNVRYYYNRIDLNNDNVPETLVYLMGSILCGTGGCSGLIFEHVEGQYKLISRFSLVRTPIIISDTMTNGWKDIIMYVAGGGIEPAYRVLTFNGERYPLNPSIQPELKEGKIKGIGIISDDLSKNPGIKF